MVSEKGLYAADDEIWCQKKDYMQQVMEYGVRITGSRPTVLRPYYFVFTDRIRRIQHFERQCFTMK